MGLDPKPIIIITAGGLYPWIIINSVASRFPHVIVLQEQPEPKSLFIRRKARISGPVSAAGQFFTMAFSRFGKPFAARRIRQILRTYNVIGTPHPDVTVRRVSSANGEDCVAAIREFDPAAVLLVSCRLVKPATLEAASCPVLNFHPGITPLYRGMWGGYWARAKGDADNYGATVHIVDAGVDTGAVLYQRHILPDPAETIFTDAVLQAAASCEVVVTALKDAVAGRLAPRLRNGPSMQYFHPPIWSYLWRGVTRGVW